MGRRHLRLHHVSIFFATLMTELVFAALLTAFLLFAALATELVFTALLKSLTTKFMSAALPASSHPRLHHVRVLSMSTPSTLYVLAHLRVHQAFRATLAALSGPALTTMTVRLTRPGSPERNSIYMSFDELGQF